jgi:hypothetical protein
VRDSEKASLLCLCGHYPCSEQQKVVWSLSGQYYHRLVIVEPGSVEVIMKHQENKNAEHSCRS